MVNFSIYNTGETNKSTNASLNSFVGSRLNFIVELYQNKIYEKLMSDEQSVIPNIQFVAINDEPFKYSFGTTWGEGPSFRAAEVINGFVKDDALKILAGNKYINLPVNDGWSQKFATDAQPLSLDLSFKIFSHGYGQTTQVFSNGSIGGPLETDIQNIISFLSLICLPPKQYSLYAVYENINGAMKNVNDAVQTEKMVKNKKDKRTKAVEQIKQKITDTLNRIAKQDEGYSFNSHDWSKQRIRFINTCRNYLIKNMEAGDLYVISDYDLGCIFDSIEQDARRKYAILKDNGFDWTKIAEDVNEKGSEEITSSSSNKTLKSEIDDLLKNNQEFKDLSVYDADETARGALVGLDKAAGVFTNNNGTNTKMTERYADMLVNGSYTSQSKTAVNSLQEAMSRAQDFIGAGDSWKLNARGSYTICIKTPDMTGYYNNIDWCVKSFSFKPSVQIGMNGLPIYVQCNLSLETNMALSNLALYRLFVDEKA